MVFDANISAHDPKAPEMPCLFANSRAVSIFRLATATSSVRSATFITDAMPLAIEPVPTIPQRSGLSAANAGENADATAQAPAAPRILRRPASTIVESSFWLFIQLSWFAPGGD